VPSQSSGLPPVNDKKYSFINVNYNRNYYRQFFDSTKPVFYRNVGLGIGFCAMGAACVGAYYAKVQADYAKEQAYYAKQQAEHAKQQTDYAKQQAEHAAHNTAELRRQNDLEELSQGIITRDEYERRQTINTSKL
jgi:hypothetical protein